MPDRAIHWHLRRFARGVFLVAIVLILGCKTKHPSDTNESENAATDGTLAVGNEAPDITLSDLNGTTKSLKDFRGKVVLLNFWATWCVPCVTEMPSLERVYEKLKDKGFEVVAVSVDPPIAAEAVKKFVSDHNLTFTVLRDPELAHVERYGVTGFPETFFIDATGRILSVTDPETKEKALRLLSDREWDKEPYLSLLNEVLNRGGGVN